MRPVNPSGYAELLASELVVREAHSGDARAIAEVSVASRRWSYPRSLRGGLQVACPPSRELFEEELKGWYTGPALWPRDRSLGTLQEWCSFELHTVVVDTGESPLDHDEFEE
jgi:hypothetical protein